MTIYDAGPLAAGPLCGLLTCPALCLHQCGPELLNVKVEVAKCSS